MTFNAVPATTMSMPNSTKRVYTPSRLYPPEGPVAPKTNGEDLGKLQRAALLGDGDPDQDQEKPNG